MKDVCGKELAIGQYVVTVFDGYVGLRICRVEKFTPKAIRVSLVKKTGVASGTKIAMAPGSWLETRIKFPHDVAIVEYTPKE